MWDEKVRGPKMSEDTGKIIFKYQMPVLERFEMELPKGAEIIRMEDQGGMFWLWAVVDTNAPLEKRKFHAYKTGAAMDPHANLTYVGFCAVHVQMELGLYIFEEKPKVFSTSSIINFGSLSAESIRAGRLSI